MRVNICFVKLWRQKETAGVEDSRGSKLCGAQVLSGGKLQFSDFSLRTTSPLTDPAERAQEVTAVGQFRSACVAILHILLILHCSNRPVEFCPF